MDVDLAHEPVVNPPRPSSVPSRYQGMPTAIPRSKRQPFYPTGNTDTTPKAAATAATTAPNTIEPLSIKKKTSVRSDTGTNYASPTPARKTYARNSPLTRSTARVISPKRVSPQVGKRKFLTSTHASSQYNELADSMLQLSQSTVEDVSVFFSFETRGLDLTVHQIESSRRTIKRIKLQAHDLRSNDAEGSGDAYSRPSSPDKDARTPQRPTPAMVRS